MWSLDFIAIDRFGVFCCTLLLYCTCLRCSSFRSIFTISQWNFLENIYRYYSLKRSQVSIQISTGVFLLRHSNSEAIMVSILLFNGTNWLILSRLNTWEWNSLAIVNTYVYTHFFFFHTINLFTLLTNSIWKQSNWIVLEMIVDGRTIHRHRHALWL